MKHVPRRAIPVKGRLSPWLMGIIAATVLFAALAVLIPLHYIGSDDTPILRSFMGYEGGVPANFHMLIHTVFAWLLYAASWLFPGVAWFSILQLFLLWFSCAVIVKSAVGSAQNRGLSGWLGLGAGLVFLCVFAAYSLCRITFTATGALAGAAAVAQLLGLDYRGATDRQLLRGLGLSVWLLLCCYFLRQINVLPPLAFWLLGLVTVWLTEFHSAPLSSPKAPEPEEAPGRSPKPLLLAALICAVSFGTVAGLRAAEIRALGLEDYLAWQNARSRLMDYTGFDVNTPPETYAQLGWSAAEFKLVSNWFFMDQNITTEAFDTLYAAQPEASLSLSQKLARIPALLRDFLLAYPAQAYACAALGALALLLISLRLLRPGGRPWPWLAALGAVFLGALLLCYLAYQGRLPLRAVFSVLFPTGAFLLCHAFACWRPPAQKKLWLCLPAFLLCGLVLAASLSLGQTFRLLTEPLDPEMEARADIPALLDEFALENPDILIIYDGSLVVDRRLFPDTSRGVPQNLVFWGGWPARSPSWNRQLEAYGLDPSALTSRDFLRDNVLVAGTDGEPWVSLMAYVNEGAAGEVDWDLYDEYGYIGFFQLYEY